jgi:hypothetical protein
MASNVPIAIEDVLLFLRLPLRVGFPIGELAKVFGRTTIISYGIVADIAMDQILLYLLYDIKPYRFRTQHYFHLGLLIDMGSRLASLLLYPSYLSLPYEKLNGRINEFVVLTWLTCVLVFVAHTILSPLRPLSPIEREEGFRFVVSIAILFLARCIAYLMIHWLT